MFAHNQAMRLWLLQPRPEVLARPAHPWTPPFDKTMRVLVRAASEGEARRLAQTKAGNEGRGIYQALGLSEDEIADDVWLTSSWTICEVLTSDGEPGVILVVHHSA
jgi:hypothetical protein